jgi:hypothetical protein
MGSGKEKVEINDLCQRAVYYSAGHICSKIKEVYSLSKPDFDDNPRWHIL